MTDRARWSGGHLRPEDADETRVVDLDAISRLILLAAFSSRRQHRISKVTISVPRPSSDPLTGFPVLVRLMDGELGDVELASGRDIRCVAGAGQAQTGDQRDARPGRACE